jgi:hypothetical protein
MYGGVNLIFVCIGPKQKPLLYVKFSFLGYITLLSEATDGKTTDWKQTDVNQLTTIPGFARRD